MPKTTSISVRVPAGLHWDCGSCGDCCRNFVLGPVSPKIIQTLKDEGIAQRWAPASTQDWYHIQQGPTGEDGLFLSAGPDGACIFLRPDNLCSIHAELGPEYKPAFCREYPYHGTLDRNTLTLTARSDCSRFHESFDSGTPVEERAEFFAGLERPYGIRTFQSEQVVTLPGLAIPYMNWTGVEADSLEQLDTQPRSPEQSVGLIRALLQEEIGGEWPAPQPKRAATLRVHLTRALIQALHHGLSQQVPNTPVNAKYQRQLHAMLNVLESVIEHIADAPPPLDPRSKSYFDIILRSNLMSKALLSYGPLSAGLGLHLLGTHLVRVAAANGNSPIPPHALGAVYAPWIRFTHNGVVQNLLRQAADPLSELFLITPMDENKT